MVPLLDVDRANDFAGFSMGLACPGMGAVAFMLAVFWPDPAGWLRLAVALGLAVTYPLLIAGGLAWRHNGQKTTAAARAYLGQSAVTLAVNGLGWAVLLCLCNAHATALQRNELYGAMAGGVAVAVMITPLLCAMSYVVPLAIGCLLALAVQPVLDGYAPPLFLGFTVFILFACVVHNKRLTARTLGSLQAQDHAEVIKMLLRDFEASASDWLWETDADLHLQNISKRFAEITRSGEGGLKGVFPRCLVGDELYFDTAPAAPAGELASALEAREPFSDIVIPLNLAGEERFWSFTGKPNYDRAGRFTGYHGVGSDITAERRQQAQIAYLARHDALTGLPNRMLFNERLEQFCEDCAAIPFALVYLDLDFFKTVNDTLGHAAGDAVLVGAAERMRKSLPKKALVARLGGDEFAILLPGLEAGAVGDVIERTAASVSEPYPVDGQQARIGVSIGIAMAPRDGTRSEELLLRADLAMYRAKSEGKGRQRFYNPSMDERQHDRRALYAELRGALGRDEFIIEFQPFIDFSSNATTGAEALLRWRHPERGIVPPNEFIPLLEEGGIIAEVGEWVLAQVCKTAAAWPAPLCVAVNLSPLQFRSAGLVEAVEKALAESGLAAHRLELEITESTLLEDDSQTVQALRKLHGAGVRIALDDFGTGYSSLSYLRRFPFDKVKIDRSFIRDLSYESDESAIVQAIISLAGKLRMTVIAEGVESCAQWEILRRYGCPQGQGFLFSKPLDAAGLLAFVAADVRDFGC